MNECKNQELLAERSRGTLLSSRRRYNADRHFDRLNYIPSKIYVPRLMSTRLPIWLAVASLLCLTGCAAMKVKLGMRVSLAKTAIASMQASLPKGPAIAPGEKSPLVVKFTRPDGSVLVTEGTDNGKVPWSDIEVDTTVITYVDKGKLSLPSDPRVSDGKVAHVIITVPSHPGIRADLDIPPQYDYNFTSDFSGSRGSSGMNGSDGMNGTSGSMGSNDPNNSSPGGNGSNGTDGSNGQDGGPGGNAPPVQVRVAFRPGSHPLLQISVTAVGEQKLFLVDPHGGSLTVKAEGGAGGSGGRGGRGGRGGSGGMGSPSGTSGRNGSDGRSGFDGSPGRSGSITVTYHPQAKRFLDAIHLSNHGGPAPAFKEEPVAALW
ncbi:MAG TPA: hypothetical protein VN982_01875 [Candidatus Dormibacteraeota bacterium]|nr:hypothetical protein [Candidatus Dormibacteraeota bacterium]